jgi:oxaloacetate decarboxylase alpha subunit
MEPLFEKTKEELKGVARSDEDVLSYIAFPQIAEKFFEEREERENVTVSYSIVKK